ncbi:MAG: flagellar protein FlgN [Paracoccaceae bacterium]
MTQVTFEDILESLDELLEQERIALINGEIDQIGDFLIRKEELVNQLNATDITKPDEMGFLQGKVTRNQVLLDNALEGIRTVARRLSTLRSIRKSLDTYDANGNKKKISASIASSVEKRA